MIKTPVVRNGKQSTIGYQPDDLKLVARALLRSFFEGGLPEDYEIYGWMHWLILDHCIQRCKKKPDCEGCQFHECKERLQ